MKNLEQRKTQSHVAEQAGAGWSWSGGVRPGRAGKVGAGRVGTCRVRGLAGMGGGGVGGAGQTRAALAGGDVWLIHKNVRRNRVECRFGAEYQGEIRYFSTGFFQVVPDFWIEIPDFSRGKNPANLRGNPV